MIRKEVKKLFKGMAGLRDYDVKDCIEKGVAIQVQHGVDTMILSPEDLKNRVIEVSPLFKSKTGGKNYHLYSYDFIPDRVEL